MPSHKLLGSGNTSGSTSIRGIHTENRYRREELSRKYTSGQHQSVRFEELNNIALRRKEAIEEIIQKLNLELNRPRTSQKNKNRIKLLIENYEKLITILEYFRLAVSCNIRGSEFADTILNEPAYRDRLNKVQRLGLENPDYADIIYDLVKNTKFTLGNQWAIPNINLSNAEMIKIYLKIEKRFKEGSDETRAKIRALDETRTTKPKESSNEIDQNLVKEILARMFSNRDAKFNPMPKLEDIFSNIESVMGERSPEVYNRFLKHVLGNWNEKTIFVLETIDESVFIRVRRDPKFFVDDLISAFDRANNPQPTASKELTTRETQPNTTERGLVPSKPEPKRGLLARLFGKK